MLGKKLGATTIEYVWNLAPGIFFEKFLLYFHVTYLALHIYSALMYIKQNLGRGPLINSDSHRHFNSATTFTALRIYERKGVQFSFSCTLCINIIKKNL